MSRGILSGLALAVLVLAGCQGDAISPNTDPENVRPPDVGVPYPTHIGDVDLAAQIEADLTCLYAAGLIPNESSGLGKFNTIKDKLAADDTVGARDATDKLISFIELKYAQYANQGGAAFIDCDGDGTAETDITELKDGVILRLGVYVNTPGGVCEIPGNNPGTFCETPDDTTAFVYFPPTIFAQLTYVSIQANPPGLSSLQNEFDEYPTYVRVLTAPITSFENEPLKPLVIVCFNDQVAQNPTSLLARLLLGSLHTNPDLTTEFKLLPKPIFEDYPPEVLLQAQTACGDAPTSALGFSNRTVLGRVANKVLNAIMPAAVQAQFGRTELSFGGVGGSAEEFSDFGGIDPGMRFGGVGGSAEEFAPPALAPGAPALLPVAPPPGAIVGMANDSDSSDTWATVTLKTDLGVPIVGASVTFSLANPITSPYDADPSDTKFCTGLESFTVATDGTGTAIVDCLNFGTVVGFRNLRATVDPATVDPAACVIISDPDDPNVDLCALYPSTVSVNYLVATIAGDPAQLTVTTAPGLVSAVAGAAMNAQPVIQVRDAGGNPVGPNPGLPVTATVSAGGTLSGTTSITTDANGVATFTNLALAGVVGTSYTITFATGALTSATADVTVSGAGAAASFTMSPTSAAASSGGLIPTLTATVVDASTNPVAGVSVTAGGTGLGCYSASTTCGTATTNGAGQAVFDDLSLSGLVGPHTVTFASGSLTSQDVTVTLSAGAAANLNVSPSTAAAQAGKLIPSVTATVTDASTNPVSGATVNVAATGLSCFAGSGCTSGTTNSSGQVVFGDLSLGVTTGDHDLTFTSGSLTPAKTTVTISAGSAAVLSVSPTSTSAAAGAQIAAITATVKDAFTNPVSGATVNVAATGLACYSGGSSCSSGTTDGSGNVTFSDLSLGTTVGNHDLTFTLGSLTPAKTTVTISAGAAAVLTVSPTSTSAAAGGLIPTLTATVKDNFTNPVSGVPVTAAATGLACFSGAGCTGVTTNASGNAVFDDLEIGGLVGGHTVTFTAPGLADATATVTLTPGAAASIAVAPPPVGGDYGTGLTPFVPVTPTPTVNVTDTFGNLVTGATVVWMRTGDLNNGGSVSGTDYTATWTLGDGGGNGLSAYLGNTSGPSASFAAVTATGGIMLACDPSGQSKKASVGNYNAAAGTYTAYFSMQPELAARIRSITLYASVTGQSSSVETYPATLKVYRGATTALGLTPSNLIASSVGGSGLTLPGDNGTAAPAVFTMIPNLAQMVARPNNNKVIFELVVEAASNRTVQLWYNSKATGGTCGNSIVYTDGVTDFTANGGKDISKGLQIRITN